MAALITMTNTLNITTLDDQSYETVYKINGEARENLSLADVRAVYQPVIDANLLYNSRGNKVVSIARASSVSIQTAKEDLT